MKLRIIAEASHFLRDWEPKTALPEGQHVIAIVDGQVQLTSGTLTHGDVEYLSWDVNRELWVVDHGEHEGRMFDTLIIAPQEDE